MARQSERPRLMLHETERNRLLQLAGSRTAPKREVERANILLRFAQGDTISDIQRKVGVSRPSIYVRKRAEAAGHTSLLPASKSTIWRILNAHEIKPHRIRYYLERRDEQFETKMHEVLMVYREIAMDLDATTTPNERAFAGETLINSPQIYKPF